jgi:putative OPT family oligopeptide transporter
MLNSSDERGLPELTVRAIVLGGLITLAFTAANVYLGLKVGLTFSTSIPAAVISMAVLRQFKFSSIFENNIVQTVASAAGTLSAIIFVLPGLVMIGWWSGFPYWMTMMATGLGGILGVMFSVPLRRALVVNTDLPYPEGRAAAEVLMLGDKSQGGNDEENRQGLIAITVNSIASAVFFALSQTRLVVDEAALFFRIGAGSTGVSFSLSMALFGVGHLVGLSVGMAMLVGIVAAWGVLVPLLTAAAGAADSAQHAALGVFRTDIRFFGAGVIGVAALWTFSTILGPIVSGLRSALAASNARARAQVLPLAERDLPIKTVGAVIALVLVLIAVLLWQFIAGGLLAQDAPLLIGATLVYVLVAGVVIASICGYMAGLIGASNSPISGVGILAVVAAAFMIMAVVGRAADAAQSKAMVAYALFATGIVFGIATISNDNLQDLKTGQLVGATPWRQQVALVFGVIFGSLIIPPVLSLLNTAYGFAGTPGAAGSALAAPQAALISALAEGVLGGQLNLRMIGYGALFGAVVIALDALLGRGGKMRLPPLAIGLGIYLPMGATLPVVIGSVAGHLYDKWADRTARPEFAKRLGVLTATGMIVGESLFGVLYAGIVVVSGKGSPFALVGEGFETVALIAGVVVFFALVAFLYRRTMKVVSRPDVG